MAREVHADDATGADSLAASVHPVARTATAAQRSGGADRTARSGDRDVGGALVRAAVRVDEGGLHRAARRRLQREGGRGLVADALPDVEGGDGSAAVGGGAAGDV